MSCCGDVDCGLSCPHALLGWSATIAETPITFAAYMALSPEDSEAAPPARTEEVELRVPA